MKSVSIELGDDEYELEVDSFDMPEKATRDYPGSGASADIADVVRVRGLEFRPTGSGSGNAVSAVIDKISYNEFIDRYMEYHDITNRSSAEQQVHDDVCDDVMRQYEDDFEDSREADDDR